VSSTPESRFAKKVKDRLDSLIKRGFPLYYFVKEAGSIRGIPDIILCANGNFIVWELKPTEEEANKTSGRIVLQKYTIERIQRANGAGTIVHPGNMELAFTILEGFL
jgi:hypothetical protein